MKTVKDIREKLKKANEWESWMEELQQDERKSVQTLLNQWNKKKNLADQLIGNHEMKIEFDQSFKQRADSLVAGIDEAGRGPLAGPVVTAAVILPDDCSLLVGLDDSKKLSKEKREAFAELIREVAISYSVHVQSPEEIDRQNIYQATKLSMSEAALSLDPQPSVILADAMKLEVSIPCESIIKGDAKSLAIAAASILAKTGRDAIMDAYDEKYPVYGFANHAGYGTPEHVEALKIYGPCPIHRKTFEPVKSLLQASR